MMLPRTSLPVLLYHHVGPLRPRTHRSMTVDPARFRQQLEWLRRRGYRSLTVEDVERWTSQDGQLPRRRVLITFDDGYADLAEAAFPSLRAAGFSATVFVVSGLLGARNEWDDPGGHGGHRLLDADEIRRWAERGIEFGAHTRTHLELDRASPDVTREEIVGSKQDLEDLLQRSVRAFAYPYGVPGKYGHEVAAANFSGAFCDADGLNLPGDDPHLIRRTMVQPRDRGLDLVSRLRLGRSLIWDARGRLSRARTAGRRRLRAMRG
jgi:peptidoglycan/xylan/chitin deacetylase (PgdA/CDA1 family)